MFHIIDDEESICKIISELIMSLGYRTKIFLCPIEYIDYTNSLGYNSPIAIFSDVRMPKMSGFEMMDIILESKPNMKFILMSGYSLERGLKSNQPYHHLSKPFAINHLEELLNTIVK